MGCVLILLCTIWATLSVAVLMWIRKKRHYWQQRQVATESMRDLYRIRDRKHIAYAFQRVYNKLKAENKAYAGVYSLLTPSLVIADLDLLKLVYISEFESFSDRGFYTNYERDPLSKNLVRLHGDLWRKVRTKLTPTFTSGKMKFMFGNVEVVGQRFVEVMRENVDLHDEQQVEIRDLCARFTTDVVGSVAFGLDCNSLREPYTEFRVKGDKAFYTTNSFVELISSQYPHIFHKLGYKVFTNELIDFYSRIVRETVEYREKNQIKRNDFLDLLIELKNSPHEEGEFHLEMEDLIAQAFVFFIGGFETSSSTMSFALYELARNPQVQEKARDNIKEALEMHKGEFSYESLNDMLYVKQVVQETLRKHPVAPTGRRHCRQPFTLPGPDALTIEPGVHVMIPVYAIHHDPTYYPQPDVFRPERFSPEEKDNRHPMAYLPFGAGPRTCIAERFGMMQSMLGVALLLRNFKFSVCAKTPEHLNFDPFNERVFTIKEGIHLRVEKL